MAHHRMQYLSDEARHMKCFYLEISDIIYQNLGGELTRRNVLEDVHTTTIHTINQIEMLLQQEGVRCNDDPRLGRPNLNPDPRVKTILKRLENSVHVLCLLADVIQQNQNATQAEIEAITLGRQEIRALIDHLRGTFPNYTL